MKLNGIKALDYQLQNAVVTAELTETTLEEIAAMDAALLKVETDDGDLVDAFSGYRFARATYEVSTGVFSASFEQGAADTTAAALAALTEQLVAAEAQNKSLQAQLDEQADALIELADLLTEEMGV